MCGIIGYCGPRQAAPVLLDSLKRLEYRGYDSAGIAVLDDDGGATAVAKSNLKVADLVQQLERSGMPRGHTGIGHTRWATHGRPTVANAHPHRDCTGRIHIIHNGIIENYRELRVELVAAGHEFTSDTDTEVVPHLIEQYYEGDLAAAVRAALQRIRGAYALVAVSADEPGRIVGARLNAPLVIGLGDDEMFVSSDITALIPYTKRVVLLGEGEVASVSPDSVVLTSLDGTAVEARVIAVTWEAEQAQKNGFPHFMLKEIHEQPEALRSVLRGRVDDEASSTCRTSARREPSRRLRPGHHRRLWLGLDRRAGHQVRDREVGAGPLRRRAVSEFRYADPLLDEGPWCWPSRSPGRPQTPWPRCARRDTTAHGVAVTNVSAVRSRWSPTA